ncbi:MAG: FtsH protease activity modulator HflK [Xylophilus ampelinus]
MILIPSAFRWAELPRRIRGMFNLNDSRWGRGDDESAGKGHDENGEQGSPSQRPESRPPAGSNPRGRNSQGPTQGPPDLDELWREFNRKLGSLFGGGGRGDGPGKFGGNNGFQPGGRGTRVGVGLIVAVVALIWLGSGFFIVQEGQQAVITQFGRYKSTVGAGFNWRLPYPIQRHELVFVSQIRSVDVGRDSIVRSTGLRESAMLTQDENIVEIKFAVQYRLKDARAYLFESADPASAVVQVAETAVREVVGQMRMDTALAEERDQIAPRVRELMQRILDRYKVGVEVVAINLQQGGVRPPEQVQAAFDDVLRAGQERERVKNEAEAYANDVVPRAIGTASRLKEEAEAYKARVVAQAQGDTQRFASVLAEYQRAPQVTRDRLYLETMQQVYSNVTKVLVDSRQNSNLLYLPLDKLMQLPASPAAEQNAATTPSGASGVPATSGPSTASGTGSTYNNDARTRDNGRTRDRDGR